MPKCERCSNKAIYQEGRLMQPAIGPEAAVNLSYTGTRGILTAKVCEKCSKMLRRLGWK